ncbi:MAG: DUF167 family protein YggU [Vibrionaceae bacterium]
MPCYWHNADELVLMLYIQPKASADRWLGLHGEEIKIAITAPPADGKANSHLTAFLAKQFKVSKSAVTIEKGQLCRHKRIRIQSPNQLPEFVAALLS